MTESGPRNQKPLFSQTFLGAVIVTVVGGVLVWSVTNRFSRHAPSPSTTSSPPPASSTESDPPAQPASVVLSTSPSSALASVNPPPPPQPPSGVFASGRPVGELRVWGYGQKQVDLVLESIENQPTSVLTLHFLLDNKYHAPYEIALLDPDNNTFVTDAQGAEHTYRSVTEMSEVEPLLLAPLSRRRFSISFAPLTTPGDSIALRATFKVVARGSLPSDAVRRVEVDSIRLNRSIDFAPATSQQ